MGRPDDRLVIQRAQVAKGMHRNFLIEPRRRTKSTNPDGSGHYNARAIVQWKSSYAIGLESMEGPPRRWLVPLRIIARAVTEGSFFD